MSLPPRTPGLHHVSVITGSSAATLRFYTEIFGLKLVKLTVNYDDPFMYHLYFGDERGTPGTLLTCFPAERGQEGRVGRPQPTATALSVPRGSLDYWADRLAREGVDVTRGERFGESLLAFDDGEGQPLELVGIETSERGWGNENVPREHAIRGLYGVTLASASPFQTASVLDALGFDLVGQEGVRVRYRVPGTHGAVVDVLDTELPFGREGIGTVHHVAFRLPDEEALEAWRVLLVEDGLEPTYVKDRTYFRSVYVREPGGVLVELATDGPGFAIDEPVGSLGETLQLPGWLEADREMIGEQLPPLERADEHADEG
ncbi:ring-cleaving dioxygenase [Salinigranum salinum]|uniref:ring-cleaving dioxygenase n=1 Tax=Salinigranum salinum TaxID=1364937 RepID=UPI002AA2B67C|nr:ring-cleaving dioxygenase [Salinigranum salinum]